MINLLCSWEHFVNTVSQGTRECHTQKDCSVVRDMEWKKPYFISALSFHYSSQVYGYVSAGSRSVHTPMAESAFLSSNPI